MRYTAEYRTYDNGEYSDWESFDGFVAENEESESFYDAEYYIREAFDNGADITEMVYSGDIEDFQVRVIDEDGKEVSCQWAMDLYGARDYTIRSTKTGAIVKTGISASNELEAVDIFLARYPGFAEDEVYAAEAAWND